MNITLKKLLPFGTAIFILAPSQAANGDTPSPPPEFYSLSAVPRAHPWLSACSLQVFGHRRSGSGGAAAFKELTKRDAQIRMSSEMEKLLLTLPESLREVGSSADGLCGGRHFC